MTEFGRGNGQRTITSQKTRMEKDGHPKTQVNSQVIDENDPSMALDGSCKLPKFGVMRDLSWNMSSISVGRRKKKKR